MWVFLLAAAVKKLTTGNQNESLQMRNKPTPLHEKSTVFHGGKKQSVSGYERSSTILWPQITD